MQNEVLDTMTSMNKTAYEAMKHLMEINAKAMAKLTEKQMGIAASCMNLGIEQMEIVSSAKDYAGYMSKQTGLMKSCSEEAMDSAKAMLDILTKTRDELTSWFESGVSTMTKATESNLKPAAKRAA
jgi:phasin family protein